MLGGRHHSLEDRFEARGPARFVAEDDFASVLGSKAAFTG